MFRNPYFLAVVVFLFAAEQLQAQDSSEVKYLRKFEEQFHLKTIAQFRPMTLRIKGEEKGESLLYQPNSRPLVGIGGQIVDIGFAIVFKIPEAIWQDPDIFGETRFHDFQFNWYQPAFAFDFQYQFYQGFYVSSVDLPNFKYEEILHRSDLQLEGYGLNGVYIFNNKNFSYAAAFNNATKHLHSVGSIVLMSSFKYTSLKTDSTLVPRDFLARFPSTPTYRKGEFIGFSIMPGYAHTFVAGDFYLNLALAIGPDLQYKSFNTLTEQSNQYKLESKINYRLAFGYDNGKFFSGVFFLGRRNFYQVERMNINHDAGFIRLSVGHRFPETSWMKDIRNMEVYQRIMNLF